MWLVRECLDWLPRLRAEESMLETTRVGVGTGSFAKNVGPAILRQWEAIAFPNEPIPAARIETQKRRIREANLKVFGTEEEQCPK